MIFKSGIGGLDVKGGLNFLNAKTPRRKKTNWEAGRVRTGTGRIRAPQEAALPEHNSQKGTDRWGISLLISLLADLILISLDFLNKLTGFLNPLNTKGANFLIEAG